MNYKFKPMSDEELNSSNLVPEGIYQFEVLKSTRKTSKSGNPMAELNIRFWDAEGRLQNIFDYLVFSSMGLNIKKVKHFCHCIGRSDDYDRGEIPEELAGYSGKFQIGIQEEQPKPGGGFYPKKNCVIDYIVPNKEQIVELKKNTDLIDDDIPF